jgi:cytochrome c oxidase assembly factor 6
MSAQKTTPLLRPERDGCYNLRDLYFSCLEKAGIEDPTRVEEEKELQKKAEKFGCLEKNNQYKKACPSSWVS